VSEYSENVGTSADIHAGTNLADHRSGEVVTKKDLVAFVLTAFVGLACDNSAITSGGSRDSAAGGQGGFAALGGTLGSGGAGARGATSGAGGGNGGARENSGGSRAGGANAGGSLGSGGSNPGGDAAVDACVVGPCAYPICPAGYVVMTPSCGCPTCVPVDAGTDTAKLDCVSLDECTCWLTNGCSPITESCWCPYPQCSQSGDCVCGGGKFIGCAPVQLTTCTTAKARVASMCPQLSGATFDSLCQQSDSACITKCLNDVTSCSDISCSMCEACDCVGDAFSQCRASCKSALGQ